MPRDPNVFVVSTTTCWHEYNFRRLSSWAQLLYLRLATGPEYVPLRIAGLARVESFDDLAQRLGWSTDDLERYWAELVIRQMAEADWPTGLVLLDRIFAPALLRVGVLDLCGWESRLEAVSPSALRDGLIERMCARSEVLRQTSPTLRAAFRARAS